VALILAGVALERRGEHLHETVEVLLDVGLTEHKRLYVGVKPRFVPKILAPKRVRQEPYIRDDVSIGWQAMLEAERFDHNVDFGGSFRPKTLMYKSGGLVSVEICRIDDHIGFCAKVLESLPLTMYAVENRAVSLQRVGSANRFEPLHQVSIGRVEEEHTQIDALTHSCNKRLHIFDRTTAPNIHDNS